MFGGVGLVLVGGVWLWQNLPMKHDAFTEREQYRLDNIKDDLVQSVAGCDLPEGDAIIKAVKKCRIVGKMPPGFVMPGDDQDGQEGTSWTIAVRFHRPYVLLGSNFFEKDRRQQFGTLIKECYVRSALGDFGETGREDNLVQKTLDQIDR